MTRWRRSLEAVARDFLEADTRWLALFRIAFGLVMLGYLLVVASRGRIDAYFTDHGLMPTDVLGTAFPSHAPYTLFRFVHTHDQAVALFAATGVVYAAFAAGLFTRVTAPLAYLLTISLHHRIPFVVNGAMVTMHLILLWAMFLPLGRHASVDAWLAARRGERWEPMRVRSFAMLALRLQLLVIYFFNVVHKGGPTWLEGQAVHYVLWQARAALPSAIWLRAHEPFWFAEVATYGTYFVESSLCVLVIVPFARVFARRAAACLIVAFHGGIALLLNLGPFPWVFACAALFLLASEDGRSIERFIGPRGEARQEPASTLRIVREVVLVAFGIHAAFMNWTGNRAVALTFGETRRIEAIATLGDAGYLWQMWGLFAPDAPTTDLVLMPVVTLVDGRVLDVRRRRTPDFEILDGRAHDTDFFQQTLDPSLAVRANYDLWEAFARYIARVPRLERWPGHPEVAEVTVHLLMIPRPAYGESPDRVTSSRVVFSKHFWPHEEPGRLGD